METWMFFHSNQLSINLINHKILNNHNDITLFQNNVQYIFLDKHIQYMH
jgi:hypothetical protein